MTSRVNNRYTMSLLLLMLAAGISVTWGWLLFKNSESEMADFKAVYYASRCLIEHRDPYIESNFLDTYRADNGDFPSDPELNRVFMHAVPICINLPTSLFVLVPLALVPWKVAKLAWFAINALILILAGFSIWNLARRFAPRLATLLVGLILADCEVLLMNGNLAAVSIGFSVLAVWCFVRERLRMVGVLLLAISLVLKPQDASLIWLCFLLAGRSYRKSALLSLATALLIAIPAFLWTWTASPHWTSELRSNLQLISSKGNLGDPGPSSIGSSGRPEIIIDFQSVVSEFRDTPNFYNTVTYLICGPLLLVWANITLRRRSSSSDILLALATIAPMSLLPIYHRQYDAKILFLSIPGCALVWSQGGMLAKASAVLQLVAQTSAGELPSSAVRLAIGHLGFVHAGQHNPLIYVLLDRNAPIALFALSIFYLFTFLKLNLSRVPLRRNISDCMGANPDSSS